MESDELKERRLLLGVAGGIAAYKAAELIRLFKKSGAEVQVLMTPDATKFISALTLGTLSENEVLIEVFPENAEGSWTKHISLGTWADLFIVAPATANTIAKLAHGFCDGMLTATALAARCPVVVCPSMDHDMYLHAATQANLRTLHSHGYRIMDPEYGSLASGLVGHGRLPEPESILEYARQFFVRRDAMKGVRVLVTAGPTRERIDPVRFLSNGSTGTMGFALAEACAGRGAEVTLVSGPTSLQAARGIERVDVETTQEMFDAVMEHADADLIIMAAAVSDYRPAQTSEHKMKKGADDIQVTMTRTPDILGALGRKKREGQKLLGFALETQNGEDNALRKLREKNLDWIVLNYANITGSGFGTGENRVTLFSKEGVGTELPGMEKNRLADEILDLVLDSFYTGEVTRRTSSARFIQHKTQ